MHHANAQAGVDSWSKRVLWVPLAGTLEGAPWDSARTLAGVPELGREPDPRARFAALPAAAERKASYAQWSKQLATAVYRDHPLILLRSKSPKLVSNVGEEEGAFRGRIADLARGERDQTLEKLRQKYAPKLTALKDRIDRANERVEREAEQYKDRRNQTALSLGASVLGALFGRKLASATNVQRAATTLRGASRAAQERADIGRAEERVEAIQQDHAELEAELARELAKIEGATAGQQAEIETLRISATKADLAVETLALVWVPAQVGAAGEIEWLCPALS